MCTLYIHTYVGIYTGWGWLDGWMDIIRKEEGVREKWAVASFWSRVYTQSGHKLQTVDSLF